MGNSRKVTWIELFFDLVFVGAAHKLAIVMKDQDTLLGVLPYMLLFLPIIWTWVGHTIFSTQFESKSWVYHMLTLGQMVAVLGMVIQIDGAYGPHMVGFAWCYAAARALLILMYVGGFFRSPMKFFSVLPMVIGYGASAVLWAVSPLTPSPIVLWILAFSIDFLTPILTKTRATSMHMHSTHFPERLGLLTVIMLGEIIISLVASMHLLGLTRTSFYILAGGVLTIIMVYWSYFQFIQKSIIGFESSKSRIFLYSHIPLFLGLISIASGFKGLIEQKSTEPLIILGIVIFTLSFRALKYVRDRRVLKRQVIMLLVLIPFLVVYPYFASDVLTNVAVITSFFVLYLFITEIILTPYKDRLDLDQAGDRLSWED
ncbi:MAG: low temperature requirement protein A [Candidatus Woesearchaeota archaeon]